MKNFIGEHICKVDSKCRILFPVALIKQLEQDNASLTFVLQKDIYENCLVLYTIERWEKRVELILKNLNEFNRDHNKFLRNFYKSSVEISLDAANRLLIPRRMLDMINVEKEIVLVGEGIKIELWAKEIHDKVFEAPDDFAKLTQELFGNNLMC